MNENQPATVVSVTIVVSVPATVVSLVGIVVSTTATVVSAGVDELPQAARPIDTDEIANAIAITFFIIFSYLGVYCSYVSIVMKNAQLRLPNLSRISPAGRDPAGHSVAGSAKNLRNNGTKCSSDSDL